MCGRIEVDDQGLARFEAKLPRRRHRLPLLAAAMGLGTAACSAGALPPEPPPRSMVAVDPHPAPAPSATPPPDVDTDGDGVMDSVDRCPNDKGDVAQGDGCPKQFVGIIVDQSELVIRETVVFKPSGARIAPESNQVLDAVAEALKAHPEIAKVTVAGHASSVEPNPHPLALARAKAVKDWLVAHGVDGARLTTTESGADAPRADNATVDGQTANRRVEFRIDEVR